MSHLHNGAYFRGLLNFECGSRIVVASGTVSFGNRHRFEITDVLQVKLDRPFCLTCFRTWVVFHIPMSFDNPVILTDTLLRVRTPILPITVSPVRVIPVLNWIEDLTDHYIDRLAYQASKGGEIVPMKTPPIPPEGS